MFEDHREVQIDEYETDSVTKKLNMNTCRGCQESVYYPVRGSCSCICAPELVTI